jgi:hypothetical protein
MNVRGSLHVPFSTAWCVDLTLRRPGKSLWLRASLDTPLGTNLKLFLAAARIAQDLVFFGASGAE